MRVLAMCTALALALVPGVGWSDVVEELPTPSGLGGGGGTTIKVQRLVGYVKVKSRPSGMGVYVDGTLANLTTPFMAEVTAGEHTLALVRGTQWFEKRIEVAENSTEEVFFDVDELVAAAVREEAELAALGLQMLPVSGGTCTIGSPNGDGYPDERPVHKVTLSAFSIGYFEVTQALWERLMRSNPSGRKGGNRPVENVNWLDVQNFIQKLNRLTGKRYRLPTEAEWECAAGGGSQKYAGTSSDRDLTAYAWFDANSDDQTHPVGQKKPNGFGLYDLSGNVWEWCADWYGGYPKAAVKDPAGPESGTGRVLRGGSWGSGPDRVRVTYRAYSTPGARSVDFGFRLALSQ